MAGHAGRRRLWQLSGQKRTSRVKGQWRPSQGAARICTGLALSLVVLSFRREGNSLLDSPIKVEAGINAEGGTVIEEAAAGTFSLRENGIGLCQREIGKRRREEIAGFGC